MAQALTYDTIEVGMALGPVEHALTPEAVRDYLVATGHPAGAETSPPVEAPGTMSTIFSTALLGDAGVNRPSGGIHAKQSYRFLAPMRVGGRITTTGRVVDKFIRNGRKTVVYEAVSVDEQGHETARCTVSSIIPK
jgi:hypothetical protein